MSTKCHVPLMHSPTLNIYPGETLHYIHICVCTCICVHYYNTQICEGLQATPTSTLEAKKDKKPRSWYLSPDGRQVVVGYDEGMLQVTNIISIVIFRNTMIMDVLKTF